MKKEEGQKNCHHFHAYYIVKTKGEGLLSPLSHLLHRKRASGGSAMERI